MEQYDIIIIGAGPGGLTAGIYAGRQGTKNLIIDRDLAGGIGREVPEMENYPGFDNISGLTIECRQKFKRYAPRTIAQASRISGVSPADISVLLVYFGR